MLKDKDHFVKASVLGDEITTTGYVGEFDGIPVYEDVDIDESTTNVEFILGNSAFCHFVAEFTVPVHVQDLNGSGSYIGASAIQGRRAYGMKISRPTTVLIKKNA